ncbi:MAG: Gfo/Idh/MocA family oxidoreductase, partial [Gemmatimonadota bacterium]|nr:Gfo/Idh/MocA family oxidoreductase [Gemmatimonadota bacterium]
DVETVRRARDAAGRQVLVAENYFYKPIAEALRRLLAAGTLGEPRFIVVNALKHQARADWRDDAALSGGGALFEGGIHWINLMANLGLRPLRVRGARAGGGSGPERSTLVTVEYDGGAVGVLAHSWEIPSPLRGLRLSKIYGTHGSATFESNGLFLLVRAGGVRLRCPGVGDLLGFHAMFVDFLRALRTDTEPRFTLALAQRDLELVEQIMATSERT